MNAKRIVAECHTCVGSPHREFDSMAEVRRYEQMRGEPMSERR